MLNVMHHEIWTPRREGGNGFDHAITRMFFCATIHDSKVKGDARRTEEIANDKTSAMVPEFLFIANLKGHLI